MRRREFLSRKLNIKNEGYRMTLQAYYYFSMPKQLNGYNNCMVSNRYEFDSRFWHHKIISYPKYQEKQDSLYTFFKGKEIFPFLFAPLG